MADQRYKDTARYGAETGRIFHLIRVRSRGSMTRGYTQTEKGERGMDAGVATHTHASPVIRTLLSAWNSKLQAPPEGT